MTRKYFGIVSFELRFFAKLQSRLYEPSAHNKDFSYTFILYSDNLHDLRKTEADMKSALLSENLTAGHTNFSQVFPFTYFRRVAFSENICP